MSVVSMKQLLEAGVHFGHQTRRWNPKMKNYIFTKRNDIHIFDLQKTLVGIEKSYEFTRSTVSTNGDILFIGTKKQAQDAIKEEATRCEMPYVNNRWLGGTLTNFQTIQSRIKRLKELEVMEANGTLQKLLKKEAQALLKEKEKLEKNFGGMKNLTKLPAAIFVVDSKKEEIAIKEARRLNIPVIAIIDTNCDPDEVDVVIPGNDDAIRAIALITKIISNACFEGKESRIKPEADDMVEVKKA